MKSNSLSWNNKKDRMLLAALLEGGGVALGPSDTVIGLFASATSHGIERLNKIKERAEKPYIILVGSLDKLQRYVQPTVSFQVEKIMRFCWPGPVTLILNAQNKSPVYALQTIAVRIPSHEGLLALLEKCEGLLSTSANKAGHQIPMTMQDVDPAIVRQVDCIIDGAAPTSLPSTILDCSGDQIVLVREGLYKVADLERIAGVTFKKS